VWRTVVSSSSGSVPLHPHPHPPEQISHGLLDVIPTVAHGFRVVFLARRTVGLQAARFEHPLDAINVVPIAYYDGGIEAHAAHDFARQGGGMDRALALGFHHDGFGWHAAADQVGAAHATFGKHRLAAGAAS